MFGARGFQNGSDYVLVLFIDKIYFDPGSLTVRHADRDCPVDKLLQLMNSHALVSAPYYA